MPPRVCLVRARCRLLTMLACFVVPGFVTAATAAPKLAAKSSSEGAPHRAPTVSTESLPALLQRGAQAFSAGDFGQAADAFSQVERDFGTEAEWTSGALPRRLLPLRGFAQLRAGRASEAAESLAVFLERFPDETAQRGFALYAAALALHAASRHDESLARFSAFEAEFPGSAQAALARLQRAEICFAVERIDEAFTILADLAEARDVADTLRLQARLRALEAAVTHRRDALATSLLLDEPWTVATMPEIAVLAFAAMETGDRLLASGRAREATRAFRLVPPKPRLVAAQRARLEEIKRVFDERAPAAATGQGAFWVDFYRARIDRIEAQLAGLESAEDYSWSLRLRLGQALLLDRRGHEAWLCFESIATGGDVADELRREARYRWILAAAELGRWSEALVIAREFVDAFPASELAPEAFFLIARAHLEQQHFGDAETVLTDILDRFPAHPAAVRSRFTRGWVRAMGGDYDAARTDFEQCIADAPGTGLAVQSGLWCGLTHHFAREHTQALAVFDALAAAHADDPLFPEILYRRAVTLHAMRDFPRARAETEKFVATFPMHTRHPEALVLLGDILMGAGELDEARRRFDAVPAEAADAFVYATFQTGRILRAQQDYAGMVAHFSAFARRSGPDPLSRVSEALHWIGWAEEQLGHPEAALPVYADVLARFGNDPAAAEVGSTLAALQKLSRRLVRNTAQPAHVPAGTARIAAGDFDGWLLDERARAQAAGLTTYHARLTVALADLHAAARAPAQSEALLLELAGTAPLEALDAAALARVGTTLQSIGSGDAPACFERILAAHPRSPERAVAFHGLGVAAANERRPSDALAWVDRFERETPTHPLAPAVALLAGRVLEQEGRHEEAVRRYESLLALRSARGRPHAQALAGLARCARVGGDTARAIACYQRIYTLYRAQHDLAAEAYLESAPLFEQRGDLAAAAASYREMLGLAGVGDGEQRDRARRALASLEQRLGSVPPEPPSET